MIVRQHIIALFLTVFALIGASCSHIHPLHQESSDETCIDAESSLLILSNDVAVVGILPRLAGRIVVYRLKNGDNVLKSNPANWSLPDEKIPVAAPETPFSPFGGHLTWVGPQSEWWTQQELLPERKKTKSEWPPDPFLLYSSYIVDIHSNNYVKLTGPVSPVSGIKLTKETALLPDGRLRHRVTARNMRKNDVNWFLWSNTQLPGGSRFYLSVSDRTSRLRTNYFSEYPLSVRPFQADIINGFFTFRNDLPLPEGADCRAGSAYVSPYDCAVAAFNEERVIIKRLLNIRRSNIHPDQELFTIHQRTEKNGTLSLGVNSPYTTITPGGEIILSEVWGIYHYDGENTADAETTFLKQLKTIEIPAK